jgi:N-acyl homoserine lactone hydrolase
MRLYVLQLGMFTHNHHPIPGFLIQTDDGTNVLVDTGCPLYTYTGQPISLVFHKEPVTFTIEANPEDTVESRLKVLGLTPRDIDFVICTHFDWDHAGCHALFTESRLVVQRRHYELAHTGKYPRFNSIRDQWDAPGLRYEMVEGDTTLMPGIELIETSGHVPGHQSVLVRLPNTGPVILAIDAVQRQDRFDAERRELSPYIDMDETEVRASTRKLADLARRENARLVIFGHDAALWRTLRKSPEYYD